MINSYKNKLIKTLEKLDHRRIDQFYKKLFQKWVFP